MVNESTLPFLYAVGISSVSTEVVFVVVYCVDVVVVLSSMVVVVSSMVIIAVGGVVDAVSFMVVVVSSMVIVVIAGLKAAQLQYICVFPDINWHFFSAEY